MKSIILFLSTALLLISCSDDDAKVQETSLIGTWKLIETYESDGSLDNSGWKPVKDSYTYTFKSDSSFTSTRFSRCTTGTYSLSSNNSKKTITLAYGCDDFFTGFYYSPKTLTEIYSFENGYLFLVPSYLSCDEGCSFKFKKVE